MNKRQQWRRKVAEHLPNLAARVFALRKRGYAGCGFHYALERTLGKVIVIANGAGEIHANEVDRVAAEVIDEVIVEGLFEDVAKIERSLK